MEERSTRTAPTALAVAPALLLFACAPEPLGDPIDGSAKCPPCPLGVFCIHPEIELTRRKIDLLVLVDNSGSMEAMQSELRARFGTFFQVFQDLADKGSYADLHVGVVTSDYGAGATGAPGCSQSGGGQGGKLQALGQVAPSWCKSPIGANYIAFDFADGGKNHNLPAHQDIAQTFTCMASVGSSGCGFTHQLESAYAALHNNLPENKGFLRDDALLAVVFLTNRDDGSAPPDTDLFDKNKSSIYGYESGYRKTRYGIVCDYDGMTGVLPPYGASHGPLASCRPAPVPPGKEYDVSRYINYFTKSSQSWGVKANPQDVLLVGIDGPEAPVEVLLSNPGTAGGSDYVSCPQLNETSNPPCVPVLQHSCRNVVDPVFYGNPAVRLNAVIRAAANHAWSSICDPDYTPALDAVAQFFTTHGANGCFSDEIDPVRPGCIVVAVTTREDGAITTTQIPPCPTQDEASCLAEDGRPLCWTAYPKALCEGSSPGAMGISICRHGAPPDPHAGLIASCGHCDTGSQ